MSRTNPYKPVDLGGRRATRPQRAPDRRALLLSWLRLRLVELRGEIAAAPDGNPCDERRLALLRAREDELHRLCRAVGVDSSAFVWLPLR